MVQNLLQQHLNGARQYMKQHADKRRTFCTFEVGDQVFLKLQPYVPTSVATCANHKLAFKFFGPFRVLERVNEVAYKIQLPAGALVHPVFHVSQLRRALLPGMIANDQLPIPTDVSIVPVQVLQR